MRRRLLFVVLVTLVLIVVDYTTVIAGRRVTRTSRNRTTSHHRIHRGIRTAANKPTERCYEPYGCFSVARPWTSSIRPINNFPESPETIQPAFCLFTRHNRSRCNSLVTGDALALHRSGLNASRKVLFIVHGYLEHGNKKWIKRMVQQALDYDDINVVVVDWVGGSGPPYTQAVANIRLVGVILAHFILFLNFHLKVPVENCHIAGHSLGAHLAGYAGQYLRDRGLVLGRITGLDPADPYFENTEPLIRLDPTDAFFVDVIHTDAGPIISGGLGLMQPSGHVDYYPNGGVQQPGCGESVIESIEKEHGSVLFGLSRFIGCNHIRSYEFFTESFNAVCPFLAVQCTSYSDFLSGQCQCSNSNCFHMGYKADQLIVAPTSGGGINNGTNNNAVAAWASIRQRPERTQAYLITGDVKPFCLYHYRITIVISDSLESVSHGGDRGWLSIQLNGDQRNSGNVRLSPENVRFEPRKSYSYVIASQWLGSSITSAILTWTYSSSVFNPLTWRILSVPALHVNRIIVFNYESNNSTVICGGDSAISSKESRQMYPDSHCRSQNWIPAVTPTSSPSSSSSSSGGGVAESDGGGGGLHLNTDSWLWTGGNLLRRKSGSHNNNKNNKRAKVFNSNLLTLSSTTG